MFVLEVLLVCKHKLPFSPILTVTKFGPTGNRLNTWQLKDLSLNDEGSMMHIELPTLTVATDSSLPKPSNYRSL